MNVNLTPRLEELVRAKAASGMDSSASELVREALRLMDEQDRLRAVKLEQLREDIRQARRGLECDCLLRSFSGRDRPSADLRRRDPSTRSRLIAVPLRRLPDRLLSPLADIDRAPVRRW